MLAKRAQFIDREHVWREDNYPWGCEITYITIIVKEWIDTLEIKTYLYSIKMNVKLIH